MLSLVDTEAIFDNKDTVIGEEISLTNSEPSILSKIAKTTDWNLERRKVKGQPIISKIVNKPSVAPFETDFETLFDDSTEKSVKRRDFCKKLSVAKLTYRKFV